VVNSFILIYHHLFMLILILHYLLLIVLKIYIKFMVQDFIKIRFDLKQQHNVEISHQSIENILLESNYQFNYENWTYSGYYLFDSLWVKINGEWSYILALFDVKFNTLVSVKLVESEDSKAIYQFLNESLRNQKKISIGTDLKHEYREAIDKLKVKTSFL